MRTTFGELRSYDVLQGVRPGEFSFRALRSRSDSVYKGLVSLTNYTLIRVLFQLPFDDFQNVTDCPTLSTADTVAVIVRCEPAVPTGLAPAPGVTAASSVFTSGSPGAFLRTVTVS